MTRQDVVRTADLLYKIGIPVIMAGIGFLLHTYTGALRELETSISELRVQVAVFDNRISESEKDVLELQRRVIK